MVTCLLASARRGTPGVVVAQALPSADGAVGGSGTEPGTTTTVCLDLGVTGVADITTGVVDIAPAPLSKSHRQDAAWRYLGPAFPLAPTLRCQPPGEHAMSDLTVAAMPGAPLGSLVVNLAPVLAPVGMALLVLAVVGTIILLVGRDVHHAAARGCRSAGVTGGAREQPADPKSLTPVQGSAS